jgi:Protein of unknown function (DUF2510)
LQPTDAPAGWYPDPWNRSALRWWDSSAWTEHTTPTTPTTPAKLRRGYAAFVEAALAWSALLLVLAVVLPVYTVNSSHAGLQPRHSLVRVFGYRVLLLVALPLLISAAVGALLRISVTTRRRGPGTVAYAVSAATLLASIAGFVTIVIGVYAIPVGVLLCAASSTAASERRAGRSRHDPPPSGGGGA